MPLVENIDEFSARMACEFVEARNGWRVFENGGASDGRVHIDPPRDRRKLLRIKIDFFAEKLEQAVNLAHRLRGDYLARVDFYRLGAGPGPNPKMLEHLEHLSGEIDELRSKLVPMYAEYNRPQREREEAFDEEKRRRNEQAEEAKSRVWAIPL